MTLNRREENQDQPPGIHHLADRAVDQLADHLASEKQQHRLRRIIGGLIARKERLGRLAEQILGLLNIPTAADVRRLRDKIFDLEEALDQIDRKLDQLDREPPSSDPGAGGRQ